MIGVITANYNSGKYANTYLKGLFSQTVKPNYVIIVDDGSTDNSLSEIEKAFQEFDPTLELNLHSADSCEFYLNQSWFKIIKLDKNYGPARARNVALNEIVNKVDTIFIADIDDVYYHNKIEESMAVFAQYPHVAVVYTDYDTAVLEDGHIKSIAREYKEPFDFRRLSDECIVGNNSAIKSKVFGVVGGYDEALRGAEDYDLWLRISEVSAIHHIPKALYQYTLTGNNTTVTTPSGKFAQYVNRAKQKAAQRRTNAGNR